MNTVTATGINTSDMLLIHRMIRRQIGLLPGLIRSARDRDRDRAARIAAHAGEMLDSCTPTTPARTNCCGPCCGRGSASTAT